MIKMRAGGRGGGVRMTRCTVFIGMGEKNTGGSRVTYHREGTLATVPQKVLKRTSRVAREKHEQESVDNGDRRRSDDVVAAGPRH